MRGQWGQRGAGLCVGAGGGAARLFVGGRVGARVGWVGGNAGPGLRRARGSQGLRSWARVAALACQPEPAALGSRAECGRVRAWATGHTRSGLRRGKERPPLCRAPAPLQVGTEAAGEAAEQLQRNLEARAAEEEERRRKAAEEGEDGKRLEGHKPKVGGGGRWGLTCLRVCMRDARCGVV